MLEINYIGFTGRASFVFNWLTKGPWFNLSQWWRYVEITLHNSLTAPVTSKHSCVCFMCGVKKLRTWPKHGGIKQTNFLKIRWFLSWFWSAATCRVLQGTDAHFITRPFIQYGESIRFSLYVCVCVCVCVCVSVCLSVFPVIPVRY